MKLALVIAVQVSVAGLAAADTRDMLNAVSNRTPDPSNLRYEARRKTLTVRNPKTADREVTFEELVSRRRELDGKRVCVTGYFDSKEGILLQRQGAVNPIAISFTPWQVRELKRNKRFKSGYVRLAGKFEYVGEPVRRRSVVSVPAGFRGGLLMQVSDITEFYSVR